MLQGWEVTCHFKYVMFWPNSFLGSLTKACPHLRYEQTTCWSSDEMAELSRGTRRTSEEQSVAPERQSSDKFCMTPSIIDGEAGATHHSAGTRGRTYMHARTQHCASTHEFDCVVRRAGIFKLGNLIFHISLLVCRQGRGDGRMN